MKDRSLFSYISLFTIAVLFSTGVFSQDWKELNPPYNLFNAEIRSVLADSSGNIYAAGSFTNAANKCMVAKWNGTDWVELEGNGSGINANGSIISMAQDGLGNIYAAGGFTNSTGYGGVCKWNGTNWSFLGSGSTALLINGLTYALTADVTGKVYIAGSHYSTTDQYYVLQWNGTQWSQLGTGGNALKANGSILSVAVDGSGNLYAAGSFKNSNGEQYVAKWNGTNWTELGSLKANNRISCIKTDAQGNVYAAGEFTNASGYSYIAKWNGISWSEIGSAGTTLNANGPINSFSIQSNGWIYAGGYFTNEFSGGYVISKWDGNKWVEVFNLNNSSYYNHQVNTTCIDNAGNVYAAGAFTNNGAQRYVAKWDGNKLTEQGKIAERLLADVDISIVKADSKGNVYAVGEFDRARNPYYLSRWDGRSWNPMPVDVPTIYSNSIEISTIAIDTASNVYAAGKLRNNSGQYYVARWDGHSWIELDNLNSSLKATAIRYLFADRRGNVYASGIFGDLKENCMAKWDGVSWHLFGGGMLPGKFVVDSAGLIYAVASTGHGADYIAKWDGTGWSELGAGSGALNLNSFIYDIVNDDKDNIYIGGWYFHFPADPTGEYNYIMKWDGISWKEVGHHSGTVKFNVIKALLTDPAGNVYAAGRFQDYSGIQIAKFDGITWSRFGTPDINNYQTNINTLALDKKGNFYAAAMNTNHNQLMVGIYGNGYAPLQVPVLSNLSSDYCRNGIKKIKIANPPASGVVTVQLDATTLSVLSDSSFSFDAAQLSLGIHTVTVTYINGQEKQILTKNFSISEIITLDVNLQANINTITDLTTPVVLQALNISGGGGSPLYTFSRDRTITNIIKVESISSSLTILPVTLQLGDNWIYVRMRNSDPCYSNLSNIDSIKLVRSAVTGITDRDFPNQVINCYPNPFQQIIHLNNLQVGKTYQVKVMDHRGQFLLSVRFRNVSTYELHLPHSMSSGIYYLHLYDEKNNRHVGTVSLLKVQ